MNRSAPDRLRVHIVHPPPDDGVRLLDAELDPAVDVTCGPESAPPDTEVLGGRPLTVRGRPAVLLIVPAKTPDRLAALAVAPGCDAAHTGLLADALVTRP